MRNPPARLWRDLAAAKATDQVILRAQQAKRRLAKLSRCRSRSLAECCDLLGNNVENSAKAISAFQKHGSVYGYLHFGNCGTDGRGTSEGSVNLIVGFLDLQRVRATLVNSRYNPHNGLKSAVSGRFTCGGVFKQLPFGAEPISVPHGNRCGVLASFFALWPSCKFWEVTGRCCKRAPGLA